MEDEPSPSTTESTSVRNKANEKDPRLVLVLLLSLGINVALAIGFGTSIAGFETDDVHGEEPPESTTNPPPSWFDQSQSDWLYHSLFKMNMRMLWIDCNRVVSAAKGDGQIAFDEIEVSALGIQRRASELASFWKGVNTSLDEVHEASLDKDWLLTYEEYKGLWNACNDCHRYTWSPAYSHVTDAMLEAWLQGKHRPEMENEVDATPAPMIPNRKIMQDMNVTTYGLEKGIATRDTTRIEFEIKKLRIEVNNRIKYWGSIAEGASKMLTLAQNNESQGMKQLYSRMTSNCAACHAQTVGEVRTIMHPMNWE